MVIPRASAAPAALGRTVFRRAATQTRKQAWRQIGRRHYASEHGGQKSSELPWIIGSVGFTVPAAVWLYGQGPKKGVHHPEAAHEIRDEGEKEEEEPAEEAQEDKQGSGEDKEASDSDQSKDESSDEKSEDSGDDSKQESKDEDKEESKDEGKDESKDDSDSKGDDGKPERKFSDDGYELPGPNAPGQINKGPGKGPGEQQQQAGDRPRTPTQREKSEGQNRSQSGAMNPYLDDDEKSKKGAGPKETAKIHGTVDSRQPARGDGKPNE